MRITTWAEDGVICTLHLAKRVDEGPVTGRELATREKLSGDYVDLTVEEFQEAYATLLNVEAGLLPCAPDFPSEVFDSVSQRPQPFPDTPFNRAWYTAGKLFDHDGKRVSFYWRVNKVMPLRKSLRWP